MPKYFALLALLASPATAQFTPRHTLMPVPASVTLDTVRLPLDTTFTVQFAGFHDARLERAVTRAVGRLEGRLAKPLSRKYDGTDRRARLILTVKGSGFATPDLEEDESYSLKVGSDQASLSANTVVGAMRGLETLLQLQSVDADGFYFQGATIEDAPRFKWRGVLIDAARHWEPADVIKRTLDGMAVVKLNVLHWHLSEDQGFRVESKRYPRLQQFGSDGNYYSQDEIRDIVAYATDRGIRVVPEFDVPGHTGSWFVGMPELASGSGPYTIDRRWGVFAPTMDPTKETTYKFLDGFIDEMATLFPDKYWHIGGDEVAPNTTEWKTSPHIQAFMKLHKFKTTDELQTYFNQRLIPIITKHGKEVIGWDEILQPDLPKKAVIQSWRGTNYLVDAVRQGRRAILSAPYYLDHIKTSGEMYSADPLPPNSTLTGVQKSANPYSIPSDMPAEQQALVLGGEAAMWGEYISSETIDSRLWPRLGALAERFWSSQQVRDVPDMYRRLEVTSLRIAEVGPTHEEHTARMIRHFATGDAAALYTSLLEYARPRGFGGRGSNQLTPYTRLIDAARPDPWNDWRMYELAKKVTRGDTLAAAELGAKFAEMQSFQARLADPSIWSPMVADAVPVAGAIHELGRLGSEALDYLRKGSGYPSTWRKSADSTLNTIMLPLNKPFGLLRPIGITTVLWLLEAQQPIP
ncbi:MAG: beta-N-acetylhexosaminidase [Gemmatimonadota bacterium]